jgi:UDP:flavonoid glycosyltransferase YjiC (YdhE family)
VSTGSRGDVQPYIAVAFALKARGYSVRFFTTETLVSLPKSFGLSTTAISPDIKSVLGETVEENPFIRGMANANINELTEGIKLLNKKSAPFVRDVILAEEKGESSLPDLCIANILSLGVAWYLALKYNIPFYELGCSDNTFNPEYASGGLPTPPFQLHYLFMRYLVPIFKIDLNLPLVEALDPDLAKKLKKAPSENTLDPVLPRGVMLSPEIAAVLHPKASPKIAFLGSTVLEQDEKTPLMEAFGGPEVYAKLEGFLASGSKPIYLGWGSMLCKSPEYMVELCARAVHRSGQRAVVLGGWAELSQEALEQTSVESSIKEYAKNNILFVSKAPHEWLFPQVSVTVHHGGAGTTTATMRAGVPTVITPLITDQHDYAYAVNKLGNGIGMQQLHKVTWEELGDVILEVVQDEGMKTRASELAVKIRKENGAEKAADAVEDFWKNYGETRRFRELWPGAKPSLWEMIYGVCKPHGQ